MKYILRLLLVVAFILSFGYTVYAIGATPTDTAAATVTDTTVTDVTKTDATVTDATKTDATATVADATATDTN